MKTPIESMDLESIRVRMGADATTLEARRMKAILLNAGLGKVTPSEVIDDVWFGFANAACRKSS